MNQLDFAGIGGLTTSPDAPTRGLFRIGDTDAPSLLTHYLSILRRRKWVVISAIAAALLLGLIATLLTTPQYTATATLEIQRETRNFTRVEGAEQETQQSDMEFYETQLGLLRARSLAYRVAGELRLSDNPVFFEMFGSSEAENWFEDGKVIQSASSREQRIREAGDLLLDHLQVSNVRLSRLVEVQFTSPDPDLSKRIVDAWGRNFVRITLDRRFAATTDAREFLEQRLAQLRTRIDESERQLVDYAAREQIITLPAGSASQAEGAPAERSILADDLVSLNRELARATADRIQAESRLGSTDGVGPEALQNETIARLRDRRATAAADYAHMMAQFEPGYPPAEALQTQIKELDSSIAAEEGRVQRTLREGYQAAREREQSLNQRVDQLQAGVLDLRRRSIQYNIFQRDADTNRELYDALLQRYKEIGIAGGVGVNNISVVDAAELPKSPSSPNLIFNILLALVAGVSIGLASALALEQIDEGVADPGDVSEKLGVALLGTVPKSSDEDPMEALADRKSALSEAYLSLQTNLSFATDHGMPKSLAVTSSEAQEGKTTTSYALAQLLARSNRRTLLIDADMRSPSINRLFEVPNKRGLSNLLSGDDDWRAHIQPSSTDNLSLLVAGPQPPNAAELLAGDRLHWIIAQLRTEFDHLIIDSPPVMGLADALLIAKGVEGTIFVMESGRTKRGKARVAIARLKGVGSVIFGAVLSKFDAKRAHYGYGYDYGYGYGYGNEKPEPGSAA